MGLSGGRVKQRIGADPRNLTWSDNAARFGHAYLSKMGWDPTTGLGVNKDGRTSHINVAMKLNMLGIGANRKDGPDAIAWKQNKDFEGVLARLNEAQIGPGETSDATPPEASGQASDDEDSDVARRLRKEEKRRRKEEKRRRKEERKQKAATTLAQGLPSSSMSQPVDVVKFRLAHRARHRAAKGMLSQSATALAEVLGESSSAPTPSATPGNQTPKPTLTSISDEPDPLIRTSTINMGDYFKTKLQSRQGSTAVTPEPSRTPRDEADDEDRPRMGLGAFRAAHSGSSTPSFAGYGPPIRFISSATIGPPAVETTVPEEQEAGSVRQEDEPKEKKEKRKKRKAEHESTKAAGIERCKPGKKQKGDHADNGRGQRERVAE